MGRDLLCRGLEKVRITILKIKNNIIFYRNKVLIKGYTLYETLFNRKIFRLNTKRERLCSQVKDAVTAINLITVYGGENSNKKIMNQSVSTLNNARVSKTLIEESINIAYHKLHSLEEKRMNLVKINLILRP